MDDMDDISFRLRVSKLEAKRELCEIERSALLREINSRLTSLSRRAEALAKRRVLATESAKITEELKQIRRPAKRS